MNIENTLKNLYKRLKDCNNKHKSGILFLVIQLKTENEDLKNLKQTKYKDIKLFIKYYIKSSDKRGFGYDIVNVSKIVKAISYNSNIKERCELTVFAISVSLRKVSRLSAIILLILAKKNELKIKEGYIIRDQEKIHLITATVVDWVDVFTRK